MATSGSSYWPFPHHIFGWLDTLLFVLGDPGLLEVWSTDSGGSISAMVGNWLDGAPPGVRRRVFSTDWDAPCRPTCRHRPRGNRNVCHAAAHYRNERIIQARPDVCKAWIYFRDNGSEALVGLARKAGIPYLITPLTPSRLDRFEREPEPPAEPENRATSILVDLPDGPIVGERRKAVGAELRKLYEADPGVTIKALSQLIGRPWSTTRGIMGDAGTAFRAVAGPRMTGLGP